MTDALQDHEGTVSIGGRTITNLRFADDIDGLAGEEEKPAKLVERLDKASTAEGMEISDKKTKLMMHQRHQHRDQSKGTEAWDGHKFKVPGLSLDSIITDASSKPEILSRIAQTTAAMTRLKPVWSDRYFSQSHDTTNELPCHLSLIHI